MARAAVRPLRVACSTCSARPGSLAIHAWASSTASASPPAARPVASRSAATASSASAAARASAAGSTPAPPWGAAAAPGSRRRCGRPGSTTTPGLTPTPCSSAGVGGVQVPGRERGELVKGLLGPVALGGQDDLLTAADVQAEHRQDAAGVDGTGVLLGYHHLDRQLAGSLDEQRGRASVQPDPRADNDATLRRCHRSPPRLKSASGIPEPPTAVLLTVGRCDRFVTVVVAAQPAAGAALGTTASSSASAGTLRPIDLAAITQALVTRIPTTIATTYSSGRPISPITHRPPCGAREVARNAIDRAPVAALPTISDGITRIGSAAANGIAPSVMNDAPSSQAASPATRSALVNSVGRTTVASASPIGGVMPAAMTAAMTLRLPLASPASPKV